MVKGNQPVQIRLTEPVIFLRGPSTGYDFRGRPQVIYRDAQPAMLRGLLTLRLSKPTRIKSIAIKLEGKARTEWPEGIGPRRLDTFEQNIFMSESTTFFSAKAESRSRSARRAASVGPGLTLSQWDLDDDVLEDDEDEFDQDGLDRPGADFERGRDRGRPPRSASALPGIYDRMDGYVRRGSFGRGPLAAPSSRLEALTIAERGPSPAYTPRLDHSMSGTSGVPSTFRPPAQALDSTLSPIASAAPSRSASDDDHVRSHPEASSSSLRPPLRSSASARSDLLAPDETLEGRDTSSSDEPPHVSSDDGPHRPSDDSANSETDPEIRATGPSNGPPVAGSSRVNRAASIRTIESSFSTSTGSLSNGSHEHASEMHHPAIAAIQAISEAPTPAGGSPAPSAPPSIRPRASREHLPHSSSEHLPRTSREHPSHEPPATTSSTPPRSGRSSFSSLLHHSSRQGSRQTTPSTSSAELPEVRAGRKSRHGSASTIVINNHLPEPSSSSSIPPVPPLPPSASSSSQRSGSLSFQPRRPSALHHDRASDSSIDDRGRKSHKFSLSAALRGLSQDVKERMHHGRNSSKSRARNESSIRGERSRTPTINDPDHTAGESSFSMRSTSGTAIPPHMLDERSLRSRSASGGQEDFVVPYGRGGAGRRSRSREPRSASRDSDRERSKSRARGRNKGMKVLTDALGMGHDSDHDEDGVLPNWQEFRKGVYNYPISFPIPVDAPPTIHGEFGSVTYRLKATVARAGALTPNMVEEVEVTMIATPQEDDLEETENVLVERQWEEQMRYQITLGGKAFPIGGQIPLGIHLMPLLKCKIHRLTVSLEEKTDYFAHARRVVRHETPRSYNLIFVRQVDKKGGRPDPLLPIISNDPNAARESPLAPLAAQAFRNRPLQTSDFDPDGNEEDGMYASLLDPFGPWHLETTLKIPDCEQKVRFSTKHDKTNIAVSHILKVTIRVERGDDVAVDAKTGRRKQFDIIIETPIKILDCRVNPQYNSLPTYAAVGPASGNPVPGVCPVHGAPNPLFSAPRSSHAPPPPPQPDAVISAATLSGHVGPPPSVLEFRRDSSVPRSRDRGRPSSSSRPPHHHQESVHDEDTLLERNIVYDQLMSGQVTETGEVPPTYVEAMASASARQRASRSQSRDVSRVGRTMSPSPHLSAPSMDRGGSGSADSRGRSRGRLIE